MDKKRNRYGLTERDMETIISILNKYTEIKNVHLFGSRAKGSYRYGSDVDLAIMDSELDTKKLARIKRDFEESSLPYNVDIVDFTRLDDQELIDHIKRVGIPFFQQERNIKI